MEPEFKVKQTNDGRYQITGTKGYRVVLNNKFDCEKHCNYLNRQEEQVKQFREQNIKYYTVLSQIKMITDQIYRESGELHIVECAIKIRELIRRILP